MSLHTNLQKRQTGYYFRIAVPIELRDTIGKKEVVKSLKTKDAITAKLRCREITLHILKWFDTLINETNSTCEPIVFTNRVATNRNHMPNFLEYRVYS